MDAALMAAILWTAALGGFQEGGAIHARQPAANTTAPGALSEDYVRLMAYRAPLSGTTAERLAWAEQAVARIGCEREYWLSVELAVPSWNEPESSLAAMEPHWRLESLDVSAPLRAMYKTEHAERYHAFHTTFPRCASRDGGGVMIVGTTARAHLRGLRACRCYVPDPVVVTTRVQRNTRA